MLQSINSLTATDFPSVVLYSSGCSGVGQGTFLPVSSATKLDRHVLNEIAEALTPAGKWGSAVTSSWSESFWLQFSVFFIIMQKEGKASLMPLLGQSGGSVTYLMH